MQNLVRHRTMSDRTCLQLVEILGLPVTMTGNFCQISPFFNDTGEKLEFFSQIVRCYENRFCVDC